MIVDVNVVFLWFVGFYLVGLDLLCGLCGDDVFGVCFVV